MCRELEKTDMIARMGNFQANPPPQGFAQQPVAYGYQMGGP